jgi:ribosome-binding protein aMBF1 (putative translation factor)
MHARRESWQPTTSSESPTTEHNPLSGFAPLPSSDGRILSLLQVETTAPVPERYATIEEVVGRAEKDERKKKALGRARQRLAERSYSGAARSIAWLRLKRGMSQSDLAAAMKTSQPHVARIESGSEDVRISTVEKLAAALGVSLIDVFSVLSSKQRPSK